MSKAKIEHLSHTATVDEIVRDIAHHQGGLKRLKEAIDDFQMTMQHALRNNIEEELRQRAKLEAGVLPEFEPGEMFDYLADSDSEFFNWCFPFCAVTLAKGNMSYLHQYILSNLRAQLSPPPSQTHIKQSEQ